MNIEPTWFVLYDGTSYNGIGEGTFMCRTKDKELAKQHYIHCTNNPYSTGKVMIITDTKYDMASSFTRGRFYE